MVIFCITSGIIVALIVIGIILILPSLLRYIKINRM